MHYQLKIPLFQIDIALVDLMVIHTVAKFLSPANSFAGWVMKFPVWAVILIFLLFITIVFLAIILHKQLKKKTLEIEFRTGVLQSANKMLEEFLEERKNKEVILRESEEAFRSLFEQSTDALALLDNGRFIDCNPATLSYLGFMNKDEITGRTPWDISPEYQPDGTKSEEKGLEIIADTWKTGNKRFEWVHTKANGEEFACEVVLTAIQFKGRKILHVSLRDISERKKIERALLESEANFRLLIENQTDLVVKVDVEGKFLFVSLSYCRFFGKEPSELLGKSFMPLVHPDDKKSTQKEMEKLYAPPHYCRIEQRALTPQGWKWLSWVDTAIVDDQGNVLEIIGVGRDISEQKMAEQQILLLNSQLENKVLERTKELEITNRELEAFSYSVSHDLRAPLRTINGFSGILANEYAKVLDEEGMRLLGIIRNNSQKMDKLIKDLLEFSRTGRAELKKSPVNMQNIVWLVWNEFTSDCNHENVSITITEMPEVHADPNLIKQVWINLIANAVKFTGNKENPQITVGGHTENSEHIFYLKDNGVGFIPDYSEKIFHVFQKAHKEGEFDGTGVGLAIVQTVVQRHGGKVWAEGNPSKGACFYFSLPSK